MITEDTMANLLGNRFAPITFSIGYLEATASELLEEYHRWHAGADMKLPWVITELTGDLSSLLSALEPLTFPSTRTLFIETQSSWTAVLDNYAGNSRSDNDTDFFCSRIHRRGVAMICDEHFHRAAENKQRLVYEQVSFSLYDDHGNQERFIEVMREDERWLFFQRGDPLPFEHTECYSARRVRDRLTPDMVAEYCAAVGIHAFDATFYGPRAILIEERYPWWFYLRVPEFRLRRMSCAEYQRQHGIIVPP